MIFLKLFLTCTFKDINLAENLTNLAENLFFKLNYAEFMEFVFSKSASTISFCQYWRSGRCIAVSTGGQADVLLCAVAAR